MLEEADRESKADWEGEPGRRAREVCNRIQGITVPVKTGQDDHHLAEKQIIFATGSATG